MKLILLVAVVTLLLVGVSAIPPLPKIPSAFSALYVSEDKTVVVRDYYDGSNENATRERVDDILTSTSEIMLEEQNNHVNFSSSECATYCIGGVDCPNNGGTCQAASPNNLYPFILDSVYVSPCTGGNLWNYSTDYYTFISFCDFDSVKLYCVSDESIPLTLTFEAKQERFVYSISDWTPGVPNDSLFLIPSYCPCF